MTATASTSIRYSGGGAKRDIELVLDLITGPLLVHGIFLGQPIAP